MSTNAGGERRESGTSRADSVRDEHTPTRARGVSTDRDRDGIDDRDERATDRNRTVVRDERVVTREHKRPLLDLGLLLLRLLPVIMVLHGIHKATNFEGFKNTVAANQFGAMAPLPFSLMVVAGQIVLPILVALGLFTRLSALLEAVMMFCIYLFMFAVKGVFDAKTGGLAGESALTYVFLMLPLVFTGPGRFSLDHLMGRRRRAAKA